MNKRLLAGLMAFCLAAGAANAAFAEDPPLSGPLHTEIATSETAAPAEPTPVPPAPAEEDSAGENTTGDELYTPTPSTTPATTATPESADPPDDEDEPAVQAVTLRSVKIQDNIKSTGELVAVVNGQSDPVDGVTYTWYRSKTGADGSWQQVTGQVVNGSDKNLTAEHPHALNAALDTLLARQSDPCFRFCCSACGAARRRWRPGSSAACCAVPMRPAGFCAGCGWPWDCGSCCPLASRLPCPARKIPNWPRPPTLCRP